MLPICIIFLILWQRSENILTAGTPGSRVTLITSQSCSIWEGWATITQGRSVFLVVSKGSNDAGKMISSSNSSSHPSAVKKLSCRHCFIWETGAMRRAS